MDEFATTMSLTALKAAYVAGMEQGALFEAGVIETPHTFEQWLVSDVGIDNAFFSL